jgi:arylsulfatase A-like enzyme
MRFHFMFLALLLCVTQPSLGSQPDVVLLMTDQHRYDELSVLGTKGAATPAIDRICRSGMMFTHAFVPTPQCSPARGSILTGRWPHRAGVVGNVSNRNRPPAGQSGPLDVSIPNLGSLFSGAGYETAYFGKWHLGRSPADCRFETVGVSGGREISLHVADFLRRRAERKEQKPMLLVVSWINPHDIYRINNKGVEPAVEIEAVLPTSVDDSLSDKPWPQRHFLEQDQGKPFLDYDHAAWKRYVRYYHQLTTQVDADLGKVHRLIEQHSPDAVTVLTSDHGDLGGAHGLPYKCPAMYEELIRVPLAISWPGHLSVGRSDALVSSIDLLPTLCELAEIKIPNGVDGKSLGPLLEGKSPAEAGWRQAMFGEYYGKQSWRSPIRMIRTDRWKFCRYTRYGEELYDLENDPAELHNLASEPEHAATKQRLATQLDTWIGETNDPFPTLTATDRKGKPIE